MAQHLNTKHIFQIIIATKSETSQNLVSHNYSQTGCSNKLVVMTGTFMKTCKIRVSLVSRKFKRQ